MPLVQLLGFNESLALAMNCFGQKHENEFSIIMITIKIVIIVKIIIVTIIIVVLIKTIVLIK